MKRLLLAILFAASLTAASQAQNRKFWVSGSLGFESAELNSATTLNSFSVQPNLGYFFSDSWALGIRFGLNQGELNTSNMFADFQEFSVAPFARHIFLRWKAFSIFVDGGLSFSDFTGDTDFEDNAWEEAHLSSFGLFVNPGFSLRLTERFSLVGSTNLFSAAHSWNDQTASWAANLNSPFNLDNFTLGFSFRF
jgi:hypothetical protein